MRKEAAVEQAYRGGQDAWSRHVVLVAVADVALDVLAQLRQRAGEAQHVVELLLVAPLAPLAVVEVLLAALLVDARRLDVAAGERADPDLLPRRRDDEVADAREDLGVGDALAVRVDVDEAAAGAPAPDTRSAGLRPAQARAGRRDLPGPGRLRARGLLRRRLALRLRVLAGPGAHLLEARLQSRHQVGHLRRALLDRGLDGDLLARRLALDEGEDLLAVGVAVLAGLERPGQRVDQLLGDGQLLGRRLDVLGLW